MKGQEYRAWYGNESNQGMMNVNWLRVRIKSDLNKPLAVKNGCDFPS